MTTPPEEEPSFTKNSFLYVVGFVFVLCTIGIGYVGHLNDSEPKQPYRTCYQGHVYYVDQDRVFWPEVKDNAIETCE